MNQAKTREPLNSSNAMNTSLNLLPLSHKKSLSTAQTMAFLQSLALFVMMIALIVASLIFSLKLILEHEVENNARQSHNSFEEYDLLTQQMQGINDYIDRVNGIHGRFVDWSAVLEQLGHAAPHGLHFEGITIQPDMTLMVEGSAKTRDDVLAMEKQLNEYPHFTDISSPLSNILQKQNLRFEFRMKFIPPTQE